MVPHRYEPAVEKLKPNSYIKIGSMSLWSKKHHFSSNYLETDLSTYQSQQLQKKKSPITKIPLLQIQPMEIRKRKQQFRERRKNLIIEGEKGKDESISVVMAKHSSFDPPPGKFRTISSEKKNKVEHPFKISSLTKKINFNQTYLSKEDQEKEEKKCQLINSILNRYKKNIEERQNPEKRNSPNISSLKLHKRSKGSPAQQESIKFNPRRGVRPGKMQQGHHLKRKERRKRSKEGKFEKIILKTLFKDGDITPWDTQELC